MKTYDKVYIGGEWTAPVATGSPASFEVTHSSTEEPLGRIPACGVADVDRAVKAARAAFDAWSRTPSAERAAFLRAIQAGIAARSQEIAETVSSEVGMPLTLSAMIQAGLPAMTFGSAADLAATADVEERLGNSVLVKEPVGVVGCITPWNYPLHQVAAKV